MISLSQFRSELMVLARIMIKKNMHVDVSYKGRAYRIIIEDLHQDVPRRVGGAPRKREKLPPIQTEKCPRCDKLIIAGVCMNSGCPSNL
jgi:hypothetical protein